MRHNIRKQSSTISERRVYEVLKELHIPFRHRWRIGGYEADFVLKDKIILEVDGHLQNPFKNKTFADLGYVPMHISNKTTGDHEQLTKLIKHIYGTI